MPKNVPWEDIWTEIASNATERTRPSVDAGTTELEWVAETYLLLRSESPSGKCAKLHTMKRLYDIKWFLSDQGLRKKIKWQFICFFENKLDKNPHF